MPLPEGPADIIGKPTVEETKKDKLNTSPKVDGPDLP
jgi:hypothetical protein